MARLATIAGLFLLCASLGPAAQAQKAPVQRGATSGSLASEMADVRQQNANMRLEVSRLQEEVADLNGKIETLEFLLSQSRDEVNRLQKDDSRIGSAIEALDTENERLTERVKRLEADMDELMDRLDSGDGMAVAAQSGSSGEGGTGEETQAASRDNGASQGARVVTRAGEVSTASNGDPDYQGSLGQLSASDLPGEAGPLFAAAKSKLLNFDFEGAETAFRAFLDRFGDDPQAGEAQYWLAEALFQQDAYAESGQAYTKMIREYPDHSRAPDALVKLARSMRLVGDMDKACNALAILPEQYPDASGVTRNLANLERTRADCDD